jgi:L-alanine-DL-glutamate epimerase-like enolase superfamily enzyme
MPHSPAAGILSTASLHAYSTVPSASRPHEYSVEYGPPPERIAELFVEPIEPANGRIRLTDRPGLGLVLDQAVVARLRT